MARDTQIDQQYLLPLENNFDRIVKKSEEIIFSVIIISMVVMGLLPVTLRFSYIIFNWFGIELAPKILPLLSKIGGVTWMESLSQYIVLWIAFLGAGTAVRQRASISIDAAPNLLNGRKRLLLRGITEFSSSILCGILIWVSIKYIEGQLEYEADTNAFLNIRQWWLNIALPLGFMLLTIRLLIASFEDIYRSIKTGPPSSGPEEDG
jgi:TRAP-type C4-dicarboxylate transport system permease small subunit